MGYNSLSVAPERPGSKLGPSDLLTAIVLTLNEESALPDCLAALGWVDDTLVFDSGSSDGTCEIAREHGSRVLQRRFDNYAAQRNAALAETQADWVLFVDADERVTPQLACEVREVTIEKPSVGWWLPRHNYIFGKLTLNAGWYPDYQLRLFRPECGRYDPERHVHELLQLDGPTGCLRQPLIHHNYATVAEFIARQRLYARYSAEVFHRQGSRARMHNYVLQPLRQFLWRFVALAGWRMGLHGVLLSALMAYSQWV
ncbi:MAG: glycosyltransferase family 2 protein, partial [Anaerolineales bacterium]|nr:glycosyltransferase family 2 protein [Anaerolineales bacterium]